MKIPWARWVAIAVLTAAAIPLQATVLVPASLDELTHDATTVVRGRIVAIEAHRADDRRGIETTVTLHIENCLKGSLETTLQFVVPGGVLGRYRTLVVGAPGFTVGERVIVFLGGHAPALPHVIGFNQGVFRIVERRASADSSVESVIGARIGGSAGPVALDTFEQRVRAAGGNQP